MDAIRDKYIKDNSVDARWFLELKSIKRPLFLHSLRLNSEMLEEQKKMFLAEIIRNPKFAYAIESKKVLTAISQLTELQDKILQYESDLSIRNAYIKKIKELVFEQELLLVSSERKWEQFNQLNKILYGDLDPTLICKQKCRLYNTYNVKLECSNSIMPVSNLSISETNLNKLREYLHRGPNLCVEESNILNDEDLVKHWQGALNALYPAWKVFISNSVRNIYVSHIKSEVQIPKGITMPVEKAIAMYAHEIGMHVHRREQGKMRKLQLFSIGLAGYQSAEEGLALMREQLSLKSFFNYGGNDKYISLAYALGYMDGIKKDFRSTYDFLYFIYLTRHSLHYNKEKAEYIASKRAWGSCVRIFRGGDPQIPGCCLYRDKIYHEGNVKMWRLAKTNPEYFSDVYLGKYDPSSEEHRSLLKLFM